MFFKAANSLRRSVDSTEAIPSTSRMTSIDRENLPSTSGNCLRRNSADKFSHCSTQATKEYEETIKSLRRKSTLFCRSPVRIFVSAF